MVERVEKIQSRLKQFHNDAPEYLNALRETLEAEVRSKFQTNKQMEFTAKGLPVCVLFDETIVKYHWLSERKFEVVEVCLVSEDRELVKELMKAQLEGNEEEGAGEECGEEEGLNDQGLPKSAGTEGSQALSEPSLSLISDHANERSIYEVDLSQFCRPPAAAK